tara:strand:- start:14613 stop:14753 length:141 start_codon:yes stop_codon:yes gene_type:complete
VGTQLISRKSYNNKNKNNPNEIKEINSKLDYIISLINSKIKGKGGH